MFVLRMGERWMSPSVVGMVDITILIPLVAIIIVVLVLVVLALVVMPVLMALPSLSSLCWSRGVIELVILVGCRHHRTGDGSGLSMSTS